MTFKKSKSVGLALKDKIFLNLQAFQIEIIDKKHQGLVSYVLVNILWICRGSQVDVSGGRVVLL